MKKFFELRTKLKVILNNSNFLKYLSIIITDISITVLDVDRF